MRVDEVDLHLPNAALQVAHQAVARPELADLRDQVRCGRQADELQRRGGGGVTVLAEDEYDADQLGEVAEVGDSVSSQEQGGVVSPAEPDEAVDDLPPLRAREEEPDLV